MTRVSVLVALMALALYAPKFVLAWAPYRDYALIVLLSLLLVPGRRRGV